jgi:WhiB family redox-sensing transcriptional regulator
MTTMQEVPLGTQCSAYPLGPRPAHPACLKADPDELFVRGAEQNRVKIRCLSCPVRTECLADALDNRVEFGVWGGMTERERRALLRRRPDVVSWRNLLERARREHVTAGKFDIAG